MDTIITVNIDDLDVQFVEELKRAFNHAAVEMRIQERAGKAGIFNEVDFWNVIGLLDWSQEEDEPKVTEPLIGFLADQPLSHIYRFSDILSEKLWHLDTRAHARVFLDDPEEEGYLSADDFLYARCAVVANGKVYYEKVLANPSLMPVDLTFEPLLYVALNAYKRKTGKNFITPSAYNFETYSNKKGWAS